MSGLRKRLGMALAAVGIVGGAALTVAPSAQAQECIASAYGNGYRVWCASGAPGNQFRAVTTCRQMSSYVTYDEKGTWEWQAGNRWSYALCPTSWYPIASKLQTRTV